MTDNLSKQLKADAEAYRESLSAPDTDDMFSLAYQWQDKKHRHVYDLCRRLETAADRIEKLEAALRKIAEGNIPRTVKTPFRDDGQPSKNDRCEHGQWLYEDCGCCIEDYARKEIE